LNEGRLELSIPDSWQCAGCMHIRYKAVERDNKIYETFIEKK
jgi:hypothetical protein